MWSWIRRGLRSEGTFMPDYERPPVANETHPQVEPMPRSRTEEDSLLEEAAYALDQGGNDA